MSRVLRKSFLYGILLILATHWVPANALTLIETWEGASPGTFVHDYNGWTGVFTGGTGVSADVVIEETDTGTNLAARFNGQGSSARRGFRKGLGDVSIVTGSTATLYARTMVTGATTLTHGFGLSDRVEPTNFDHFRVLVWWSIESGAPRLRARGYNSSGGIVQDPTIATGLSFDRWYYIWVVINNANATFDVYMNTHGLYATTEDKIGSNVSFATPAESLQTFFAWSSAVNTSFCYVDDIAVNPVALDLRGVERFGQAFNPVPAGDATRAGTPANGKINVALGWNTGLDPANPDEPNPAIKKHYVYLSRDRNLYPTDPNLFFEAVVLASGATGTYDAVGLNYGGQYLWKIEEGIDDGKGGTYAPGDPNNIDGVMWQFDTLGQTPIILSQPVNIRADVETSARFSITADSPSAINYQWYKYVDGVSDVQLVEGTKYIGVMTNEMAIADVQASDVGLYYCVVENTAGAVASDNAALAIDRMLAWYKFENNANDSVGSNHGTEIGGLDYSTNVIVTTDSQAYTADPNGTSYVELSTDAYPKAGFGQGLDAGAVSFWIKTDSSVQQAVLGNFNSITPVNDRTTVQVLAPYNESGQMRFYLRDFSNRAVELITAETDISDNQWHHVAITYDTLDAKEVKAYFDGDLISSASITAAVSNFADWHFPMVLLAQNGRGTITDRSTGQIDELKIYNYALSHRDVAQAVYDVSGKNSCISLLSNQYDYTSDCRVGLDDLSLFVEQWMECGRLLGCN